MEVLRIISFILSLIALGISLWSAYLRYRDRNKYFKVLWRKDNYIVSAIMEINKLYDYLITSGNKWKTDKIYTLNKIEKIKGLTFKALDYDEEKVERDD